MPKVSTEESKAPDHLRMISYVNVMSLPCCVKVTCFRLEAGAPRFALLDLKPKGGPLATLPRNTSPLHLGGAHLSR